MNGWEIDSKLERAMDALQCPPSEQKIKELSGGERRRVALCRLLLQEPDVLLLDEPTNHLDTESIQWLEAHLQQYKGTVIAVTHDRYFLDNVAGWILELDRGEGIPWKGNYSSWLDQKTKRLAQEEKAESKRRKTLERELEWVRMAPKARQAKQKARLGAYEKLASADTKQKEANLEIYIPNGPHLGNKVIRFNDVSKAYGDKLLFEHLSFELPPAGIVGVIGPNGAGKTTLFRLIMGIEQPDSGTIEIGDTVKIAYVDQQHRSIDPDKTVYETIAGNSEWVRMGGRDVNARAWVSRFNFSGADQEKLCGVLSGGERNRLHLALTLKDEGNVLLLDEPTNDVDVNTIRALEEGLDGFAGCAVVVSHDRWFLDRIATHILAYEGEGKVVFFEGNYQEYEENRKLRLGPDAQPKRFKYKKLMEAVLHHGRAHLHVAAAQLDELQGVVPGLDAAHAAVLHLLHHGVQHHGQDMAQGDGPHGPAGIAGARLAAAHLRAFSHGDALDGVDGRYGIGTGKTGGRANVRNMGDVGRHLGDDGNADAALDGGREENHELGVLSHVAAHAGLSHLRAGEIEFHGIAAGFLRHFGKFYPLLFLLPHDGGNDHLGRIVLLQAPKDVEIHLRGVLAQLLHVAEGVEIAVAAMIIRHRSGATLP